MSRIMALGVFKDDNICVSPDPPICSAFDYFVKS
jgi:hypothetical protein